MDRLFFKSKKGISLVSLIITIIVIIILAAIVIFTGLNTPDRANFAKFAHTFSDFQTAVTQDYMQKKAQYAIENKTRSDAQIYYNIAKNTDWATSNDINQKPSGDTTISELAISTYPEPLKGEDCYEVTDDTVVYNWNKNFGYYEARTMEHHYITDEGESFFLPGYLVEENGTKKWYVNERKWYESGTSVHGPVSVNIGNIVISKNQDGSNALTEGQKVIDGTELYINFDVSSDSQLISVTPSLPYKVTTNGEYSFDIVVGGKTITKKITVNNFGEVLASEALNLGDYVKYTYVKEGNNVDLLCRVLYNDDTYGMQIIANGSVENVTLGGNTSGTFNETTKSYYNDAVTVLNAKAGEYLNGSQIAISARCVGSNPNSTETSTGPTQMFYQSGYHYCDGSFKDGDEEYLKDYNQLSDNDDLLKENYWLASRYISLYGSYRLNIRCVLLISGVGFRNSEKEIVRLYSNSYDDDPIRTYSVTLGFRPVFRLKTNLKVTGGSGSKTDPYVLGL